MRYRVWSRFGAFLGLAALLGFTLFNNALTTSASGRYYVAQPDVLPLRNASVSHDTDDDDDAKADSIKDQLKDAGVSVSSVGNDLVYGGGPVQTAPQYYLVFWGNWSYDTTHLNEQAYARNFVSGLYGSKENWLNSTTQYCDNIGASSTSCVSGSSGLRPLTSTKGKVSTAAVVKQAGITTTTAKKVTTTTAKPTTTTVKPTTTTVKPTTTTAPSSAVFVTHSSTNKAAAWFDDTVTVPAHPTVNQLASEASRAAAHFKNTTAGENTNAQYIIFSPHGITPSGFGTQYCAWHSMAYNSPYGDLAFVNMPYIPDAGYACGSQFVNSGGTKDGISIVLGHEIAETITDPNVSTGWIDSKGQENGDKCAWISPSHAGGAHNLVLTTGTFAVQSLWSNNASGGSGGCAKTYASALSQTS